VTWILWLFAWKCHLISIWHCYREIFQNWWAVHFSRYFLAIRHRVNFETGSQETIFSQRTALEHMLLMLVNWHIPMWKVMEYASIAQIHSTQNNTTKRNWCTVKDPFYESSPFSILSSWVTEPRTGTDLECHFIIPGRAVNKTFWGLSSLSSIIQSFNAKVGKIVKRAWYSFFLFFWWDWDLNSGLHAWKTNSLLLEPYFHSILLWLF
jgi:hypothetical protein